LAGDLRIEISLIDFYKLSKVGTVLGEMYELGDKTEFLAGESRPNNLLSYSVLYGLR
jgi:hypothetical protein